MRLRSLVWLLAFMALVLPPSIGASAAMAVSGHRMMSDCDHHSPPPPCPDKGTAKHAAGLCCPLMSHAMATLPSPVVAAVLGVHGPAAVLTTVRFTGLSPRKDPPPPRA